MEDKKRQQPEEPSEEPVLIAPDDGTKPYIPRPKYQIVLAWVMAVFVAVSFILWLLEIATGGSLFGLLS